MDESVTIRSLWTVNSNATIYLEQATYRETQYDTSPGIDKSSICGKTYCKEEVLIYERITESD